MSVCRIGAKHCSAGAVTIYKCTTLPGLLKLGDFTCTFSVPRLNPHWANMPSPLSVAVDDLILWTRFVAFPLDAFYYCDPLTVHLFSIEANCVIIGACIPTLYPLIQRIFGKSALGSTKYDSGNQQRPPLQTIGSSVRKKRRPGHLSVLDTVNLVEDADVDAEMVERQRSENTGETTLRGDVEMGGRRASEVGRQGSLRDVEKIERLESDVEWEHVPRGDGRQSPI